MRFRDLATGTAFRYQGADYVKSGPLAATPLGGGGERLIPRSAVVETTTRTAPPSPAATGADPDAVRTALQLLHDFAQQRLAAAGATAADRQALTDLRGRLLRELGLAD